MRFLLLIGLGLASGCYVVPAYQREHLADPTMTGSVDPMDEQGARSVHTTREVAGGGDGAAAGGGCACGN